MYDSILPGAGGINNLLIAARMGIKTERWFARKIPIASRIEKMYHHLVTGLLVYAARRSVPEFPTPEFLATDVIGTIAQWIDLQNRRKKRCCITTVASNAVRIAHLAYRRGISLEGTKFIVTGEPFTDAKREIIERAGATGIPRYAYGGSINIGFGCAHGRYTDDIHANEHMLALITHARPTGEAVPAIHPLLCTTIDPSFPRLLLNVESGDYAHLARRNCSCALGRAGLTLHLDHIRSFEKFTSEGMNYDYGDLYELLERRLPAEFGGVPGDYQLVENENDAGQTTLTLVVHPELNGLDEAQLLTLLRREMAKRSRAHRFMAAVWEDAGALKIKRAIPHASPRGKILPLHMSTASTKHAATQITDRTPARRFIVRYD
jgi:hypothetical protein